MRNHVHNNYKWVIILRVRKKVQRPSLLSQEYEMVKSPQQWLIKIISIPITRRKSNASICEGLNEVPLSEAADWQTSISIKSYVYIPLICTLFTFLEDYNTHIAVDIYYEFVDSCIIESPYFNNFFSLFLNLSILSRVWTFESINFFTTILHRKYNAVYHTSILLPCWRMIYKPSKYLKFDCISALAWRT